MAENTVVREALDDSNYDIWSNCMETYLVSEDLWDIIEGEGEGSSENQSSKTWRRKNASALHALHVSCATAPLSRIGKLKSAKEAWDLLRSINQQSHQHEASDHNKTMESNQNIAPEEPLSFQVDDDGIDYGPFREAMKHRDWNGMKKFLNSHPGANATVVVEGRTALHCALEVGKIKIARLLVEKTKRHQDLGIQDNSGYTAFHHLVSCDKAGVIKLVQRMISVNNNLPNICIGRSSCYFPVVMASLYGFKDVTRYLYHFTDEKKLDLENVGVELLVNCIRHKLFDIATKIVNKSPEILLQLNSDKVSPFYELAKSFYYPAYNFDGNGSGHKKSRDDENQLGFLRLVCKEVGSRFDVPTLQKSLFPVLVDASKIGSFEFVSEMVRANPCLLQAHEDGKGMFCYAAECRQEKVFSLIYNFPEQKDNLIWWSNPENNNILHLVANLAPPFRSLDWKSGPILKMQRELQWFQEVYRMTKAMLRDYVNKDGLTPRQLFTETHKELVDAGEKSMKEIAQSSTVVGALIITMMFAAAFTVPGGNNDDGLPLFMSKALFKIFIVCDALSLYSAIASVLAFLGILTSRYSETDFLLKLPVKLMIGLYTLFFSVLTMMLGFCAVLALTLDGSLRYILPTLLLLLIPVILYFSPILPLFLEILVSTFRPDIFDKRTMDIPWKNIPALKDIDEEDTESLIDNPSNVENV